MKTLKFLREKQENMEKMLDLLAAMDHLPDVPPVSLFPRADKNGKTSVQNVQLYIPMPWQYDPSIRTEPKKDEDDHE